MTIWAPVVAALGASLLTGLFGWGLTRWQLGKQELAAVKHEKAAAYYQLISLSLAYLGRARSLRTTMEFRTGIKEGLSFRPALDPMGLYDWLAKDGDPVTDAWSRIQVIGTPAAVDAATDLVDACSDVLTSATTLGKARGQVASTIKGQSWTKQQDEELQAAIKRAVDARAAFIKIARKELGDAEKDKGETRNAPASADTHA